MYTHTYTSKVALCLSSFWQPWLSTSSYAYRPLFSHRSFHSTVYWNVPMKTFSLNYRLWPQSSSISCVCCAHVKATSRAGVSYTQRWWANTGVLYTYGNNTLLKEMSIIFAPTFSIEKSFVKCHSKTNASLNDAIYIQGCLNSFWNDFSRFVIVYVTQAFS